MRNLLKIATGRAGVNILGLKRVRKPCVAGGFRVKAAGGQPIASGKD
jgi:hypothetical protein